jgi:hypothetical protein
MYDIIGDVHGYADKLSQLLELLGYSSQNGIYQHKHRKAVFVGDWIDRGPQIRQTLALVRSMIDTGSALGVLGNHEFNALAFHQEKLTGGYYRQHSPPNIIQHYQTLYQFRNHLDEWQGYLDWFYSVPLFLSLDRIRVVHACWDEANIQLLQHQLGEGKLAPGLLPEAATKHTALWKAIEETLKGKEATLPNKLVFSDKDGHTRHKSRIRWWTEVTSATTYGEYFFDAPAPIADVCIDQSVYSAQLQNDTDTRPLFFGHYWLTGSPWLTSKRASCLDFSVAKDGVLAAYSWQGETELKVDHLFWV